MLWTSLGLIVVFGGATLFLHDEAFIKWKPTLLYWLFALLLGLAPLLFERNLIRQVMQKSVSLPDAIWTRLNLTWAVFFALMVVFTIGQTLYLSRHIKEDKEES